MCSLWRAQFFSAASKWHCSPNGFAILFASVLLFAGQVARSQDGTTAGQKVAASGVELRVEMGMAGTWKVGYPTRTMISVLAGDTNISGRLEIQTYDGDGVPVVYESPDWRVQLERNSNVLIEASIKHGRGNRPITVRLLDDSGMVRLERVLDSNERGVAIPATQPWIVGLGTEQLQLDQAAMKSARGALPEYSTTTLSRTEQLPSVWTSYEGVDLLLLSSSNKLLNETMSPANSFAIRQWIGRGGRCALTLGLNTDSWVKQADLAIMVPGEFQGVARNCEPGPFESFLGSSSPLAKLNCSTWTLRSGTVELPSQTANRVKFPMFAKWAFGSGKVVFLSMEIDGPELLAWSSRTDVLKMLLNDQWEEKDAKTDKLVYQGYDDLSGQLNATLDFFPNLTLGNLTSISLIAGLLCLIIGPVDYFLISRAWKRPRATWITLAVCSLGGCLIAATMSRTWKPSVPTINTLELVDIDFSTQSLFGRSFAHYYGGDRGAFDFTAHRRPQGMIKTANGSAFPVRLNWFGQPGKGLGGFDSTVATDRGMPRYRVVLDPIAAVGSTTNRGAEPQVQTAGMYGVGIPSAGTKALYAQWDEPMQIAPETNSLSLVAGSIDLLEGNLTNPLDVDLFDGILVYRRRAYTLKTRLRAGEQITLSAATLPKDVVRRLQRRQNVGGEERSSPWDPADTNKLDRLLEMIAFHQSAGGSSYTKLYNRYLGSLDCSDIIRLDRAVLLAEVEETSLAWSVKRDSIPSQAADGRRKTFVRLIVPVAPSKTTLQTSK
jgi:hypothetical protein